MRLSFCFHSFVQSGGNATKNKESFGYTHKADVRISQEKREAIPSKEAVEAAYDPTKEKHIKTLTICGCRLRH